MCIIILHTYLSVEELVFTLHLSAECASYRVESCHVDICLLFYAKHEQPAGERQQDRIESITITIGMSHSKLCSEQWIRMENAVVSLA